MNRPTRHWTSVAAFAIALLLLLIPRWISIFTESINWDELTMLARAERTLRMDEVVGEGRPGMVTLVLTAFVRKCDDAITAAVQARIFWQAITLSYLCGVFFLVRGWFRFSQRPEHGFFEGATAVALLAFLPSFVAWSVQIRSDQAALAAAVWGGVCLLSERRRYAMLGGVLFGLALLFTQKGIYAIALCGLLWIMATLARLRTPLLVPRKSELVARAAQVVIVGLCAAATLAIYAILVPQTATLVDKGSVLSSWNEMRLVRARIGYSAYTTEASQAMVHSFLLVALIIASVRALRRRVYADLFLIGTCWVVLLLGLAVIAFHGASYPYFLMTAGLFPAMALGLASGHLAGYLERSRHAVVGLACVALVLGTVPITLEMLDGSQSNQRETMHWIASSGLGAHRGYQVDGALICMADPDPIPALAHTINMRALLSPTAFDYLIDEFRRKQIAYVVDLHGLQLLPDQVWEFLSSHYLWYQGAVSVAGFEIHPDPEAASIDVIVPGRYRWIPAARKQQAMLEIGAVDIPAGAIVQLEIGRHRVVTRPAGVPGSLVLALQPPLDAELYSFIDARQLKRLYPSR